MGSSSFQALYEDHVWAVYGFIGYRVSSREEAEDLTQATFERALKAWSRYDATKAGEATWLIAIARNLVIDHFRRQRPDPVDLDRMPEPADPDSEAALDLGLDPALEAALGRLSSRDREVIALRFGGDLKGAEIAELLDISLANVQQILSRALRRLRSGLEAVELDES